MERPLLLDPNFNHSLFLAAVARPLRVTLAADGAADVVVRLPRPILAVHGAERKVELPVLELGRAAVAAARAALSQYFKGVYKITNWPTLILAASPKGLLL